MDSILEDRDAELARLIEEQQRDAALGHYITPERSDTLRVEAGMLDDLIGLENGDIISFEKHAKGTVLVGSAAWHGTLYGYSKRKCKCTPCRAAMAAWKKQSRLEKKELALTRDEERSA